ncbi:FG-GAP repeat domain-containing protein [Streptomyces kurssanovii]|uniref:VCBS repeat-containing protein n=1 Tax=Streptomyces kurssanovii TaxID=67312 RepID=A0ABV3HSN4_9ACTN
MAELSGLKRGRTRARLAAAATAAALLITGIGAGSASAADPAPSARSAAGPAAEAGNTFGTQAAPTPYNYLYGVNSSGILYGYEPNGTGLGSREYSGENWGPVKHATQVDHDADGLSDGIWAIESNGVFSYLEWGGTPVSAGTGWGIYNKMVSPGDLGGAAADDLIARDSAGALWIYLGYGNGKVTGRTKVGNGWQTYNQITGKGDLTGDGRADIVARDGSGTLWLYKGTGNRTAPFSTRTKIGTGWNIFNNLTSVGDIDLDDKTDMIARHTDGSLWLYKGTGSASSPFKAKVKIGSSGWNTYRLMF